MAIFADTRRAGRAGAFTQFERGAGAGLASSARTSEPLAEAEDWIDQGDSLQ